MKIRYIFLTCLCLLWGAVVWGQTNLITNSNLEIAACGDSQGDNCDHFHDCVTGWTITHGTPNYGEDDCGEFYPDNHYIQLICQPHKSEGVMTDVVLEPGCHQLFIKVRVASIELGNSVNLRVSLDNGLQPWSELACQQILPDTDNTTMIYNEPVNVNNNNWQWVIVDFGVDSNNEFLDQLMITGLSENAQANLHIDCIYLYRNCQEAVGFTAPVNGTSTIADGVYNSCSYILVDPDIGGTVNVPMNANVVLNAADEIRILHNFRAQHNFRASLGAACTNPDESFRPDDCYDCPGSDGGESGSLDGRNEERSSRIENTQFMAAASAQPIVSPNPASDVFEIKTIGENQQVSIYNLLGKLIYTSQESGIHSIDASTWSKGVYIIEVSGKSIQEKSVTKLIVQ